MNILKIDLANRNWFKIILWWEIRRVPYNLIMIAAGYLSFYIAFVTIPLVYLVIGLGLNIIYTFGWIIELLFIKNAKKENIKIKYPYYAFLTYLITSVLFVFGIAILILR